MKNLKAILNYLIEDESGQGATEYILLLVIIVGLVMIFHTQIETMIKGKLSALSSSVSSITSN